ncbi:MAG TPA: hypothetical protein VKR58_11695 [Aquella sp.]|nr:hypothetical protein [Aquella sp.]
MNKAAFENTLRNYPRTYITEIELKTLLGGTRDSCYAKIKRLSAEDKLLHVRRGLYCLTEKVGYYTKPHPFALAQYIYGPSCISLESALSFHQLIPEAVYTITSTCTKRSREFSSPLGLFTYTHLPIENFYTEVDLISQDGQVFFMARPWRAICDYAFCYKKNWHDLNELLEELRINLEDLPKLTHHAVKSLSNYYKNDRLSKFLIRIKSDLNRKNTGFIGIN